jgi:hypothetical protein
MFEVEEEAIDRLRKNHVRENLYQKPVKTKNVTKNLAQ